jgi:hypothetical protein
MSWRDWIGVWVSLVIISLGTASCIAEARKGRYR